MVEKILWLEIERSINEGNIAGIVSYRGEIFIFDHISDRGDSTITLYYESQILTPNYGDRLDATELMHVSQKLNTVTRYGDNNEMESGDKG